MKQENQIILKKRNIFVLIAIALSTIVIWQLPFGYFILYPFTILGTWFHEMGHGLTALILGGSFVRLEIFENGSGLAVHTVDVLFGDLGLAFVAAGGPIGPTLAGALFIIISRNHNLSRLTLLLLGAIIIISVIIWVRTIFGILFLPIVAMIIIILSLKASDKAQVFIIQLLGIQAFASVYQSIGYLMSDGGEVNQSSYLSDTAVISQLLFFPHWFWAGIIIIFSILLIYLSLRIAYK